MRDALRERATLVELLRSIDRSRRTGQPMPRRLETTARALRLLYGSRVRLTRQS